MSANKIAFLKFEPKSKLKGIQGHEVVASSLPCYRFKPNTFSERVITQGD